MAAVYAGSALRGYGNLVIIKHSDDYLSAYAHTDKILVKKSNMSSQGRQLQKWAVQVPIGYVTF